MRLHCLADSALQLGLWLELAAQGEGTLAPAQLQLVRRRVERLATGVAALGGGSRP